MGLLPNVLMEVSAHWAPWTHDTLEQAMVETKRRLGLFEKGEHDEFLEELLRRRLTWEDERYVWPSGVRSALVYWNVGP